ncbi:MAG: hypothetical protein QM753_15615 [Thermomicrobiales bacterium]
MTALPKTEISTLRPSIVIAEALVDRQEPAELADRARELGFSRDLTEAVVHACCRGTRTASDCGGEITTTTISARTSVSVSAH